MAKYLILTISILYFSLNVSALDKCKGQDLKMSDQQVNNLKECLQEAGAATVNDVTKEKSPCFMKCSFVKERLLDDKGQPIKEEMIKYQQSLIPDEAKPAIETGITKCFEDPTASKVDPNEANCMGYEAFGNCMYMALMEACK